MVHRDEVIAEEARGAVRAVLAADAAGDGALSRDAVQLVADLVKRRKCVAPRRPWRSCWASRCAAPGHPM